MESGSKLSSDNTERVKRTSVSEKPKRKRTKYVWIRSLVPADLAVKGASGREYRFPRAGSEVKVAEDDVPGLLARRMTPGPCCGAGGSNDAFELV